MAHGQCPRREWCPMHALSAHGKLVRGPPVWFADVCFELWQMPLAWFITARSCGLFFTSLLLPQVPMKFVLGSRARDKSPGDSAAVKSQLGDDWSKELDNRHSRQVCQILLR